MEHGQGKNRNVLAWHKGKECACMAQGKECTCMAQGKEYACICSTIWVARADDSFVCFGAKPDKGFLDLKSRRIQKW